MCVLSLCCVLRLGFWDSRETSARLQSAGTNTSQYYSSVKLTNMGVSQRLRVFSTRILPPFCVCLFGVALSGRGRVSP